MSKKYDSRLAEKLVALLRYETAPSTGGISPCETLEQLLDLVRDEVLNPVAAAGADADYAADELNEINARAVCVGEHLIRALVVCGLGPAAEGYIEDHAQSRRECAARFKRSPEVPFANGEREALAKAWDEAVHASAEAEATPGDRKFMHDLHAQIVKMHGARS